MAIIIPLIAQLPAEEKARHGYYQSKEFDQNWPPDLSVQTGTFLDKIPVCDHSKEAIEQYFHLVLFIMLFKVVLTLSVDKTLVYDHSIESY